MSKKEPKRILQVVGAMNRGGTETMLMNIYRNINHQSIQFDFISYSDNRADYDNEIEKLGGKIIRLQKTESIIELYRAIKENGPYVAVHSHTLFHCGIGNVAAQLAGVKIRVAHSHTTMDNHIGLFRKMYIVFMRALIKKTSTNLLACSQGAAIYLFGKKGLESKKYSYFPNAIDYSPYLNDYHKEVNRFKLEEGLGNSTVIGHVGRFIEAKNHTFLLQILKCLVTKVPNVKLLLVGDGDLRMEIENIVKNEGLYEYVRFLGLRKDIPMLLQCMDVFVFPSRYEGLGLVLLEAQASGIPCIVSEAIQPEANLQLGLMTTKSLSDGPEEWAEHLLLQSVSKQSISKTQIIHSFEQNGYSITLAITKLFELYQFKGGDYYEKRFNSVL